MRILYGVHGTGHGHAMRALTIARKLQEHEFLFVAADDALKVLQPEFKVKIIPNLGTVFKEYAIDFSATIKQAIKILLNYKQYLQDVIKIIKEFKPDVCMTDLEFFVPRAATKLGIPCLTLDHQHIITCCQHDLPLNLLWDNYIQGLTPKYLFKPTQENLLVSFYAPPALPQYRVRVVPPILRDLVLELNPKDDGHILVYQSNSTDKKLIDFLRTATKRTCYVFGYSQTNGKIDNVIFKEKSETEFLNLLESCSFVIQGGSHTLMTESLFLGKAILSIPLKAMVEQRFNAFYLEKLGYGKEADMANLKLELLADFEEKLPRFQANIAQAGNFCGNDLVFSLVDSFIRNGALPDS